MTRHQSLDTREHTHDHIDVHAAVNRRLNTVALLSAGLAAASAAVTATARADDSTVPAAVAQRLATPTDPAAQVRPADVEHTRYFVANDPYLNPNRFWHLDHPTRPDLNIVPAWAQGYTGAGVVVGIVDDGFDLNHVDLRDAYVAAHSYDFGQNDGYPGAYYNNSGVGQYDGDNHGTAVAGLAVSVGGNGIGGLGTAPKAGFAGLRIDFRNQSDQQFIDATRYHSDGVGPNGSAIAVKNHSYGISAPYIDNPAEVAALNASAANGTIHVFAAGNERADHENVIGIDGDANKKALQASPESIAVAALGPDGTFAAYSNWGANIFVTAPSSDDGVGVFTIDRTGDGLNGGYNHAQDASDGDPFSNENYTSIFGGTSAAAPMVSGVMALGKEANPNLDGRFAKHLLARTADSSIDPLDSSETSDGGWKTNAAGYRFNQNYGFGLIDADAFVTAATQYQAVSPLTTYTTGRVDVGAIIPDALGFGADPGVLSATFTVNQTARLEDIVVNLDITHAYSGDIQATLTSPSGTSSRLMLRNVLDFYDDIDWDYTTNAFWGEQLAGQWTLTVEDWYSEYDGVLNGFEIDFRSGYLIIPAPLAAPAALACAGLLLNRRGSGTVRAN